MELSSIDVTMARNELRRIEQWVEYIVQQAEEDSSGFFGALRNLTPQNLWGFYPAIFGEGKPFSSQELEGSKRILSDLRRMQAGAEILIHQLSQDSLVYESPLVREFLQSPFGELVRAESPNDTEPASVRYYRRLIDRASLYGATHLATAIADDAEEKLNTTQQGLGDYYAKHLEKNLPSRTWRFCVNTANVLFSLDSLFLFGVGGLFGRVLGTTLSGVIAMESSLERMGKIARVIPGCFAIQGSLQFPGGELLKLGVNLTAEWWKLHLCIEAGNELGGSEGAKVATYLTMFMGGVHMAYGASVCESYLSGLRRKEPTTIAQYLLEKNAMTKTETTNLLRRTHGWLTHRSGRLTRADYSKVERSVERGYERAVVFLEEKRELRRAIGDCWREIETIGAHEGRVVERAIFERAQILRQEASVAYPQRPLSAILKELEELKEPLLRKKQLLERAEGCFDEIIRMAERMGGTVASETLTQARSLAAQARIGTHAELEEIFGQLAQIRSAVSRDLHRYLRKTSGYTRVPETKKRGKGGGGNGSPRRARQKRSVMEEPRPASPKLTAPAVSPFQSVISNPPPQFEFQTFHQLANGRVSLTKRAKREIEEFYGRSENTGHRSTIWRALSDLDNGNLRVNAQMSWRRVQKQEYPTVRTRIGSDYRLMAIQLEDKSYRVVSLRLKNKRTYKS